MKQSITVKQVNELSKEARARYVRYCTKKAAPSLYGNTKKYEYLMDIGQMIEFLQQYREGEFTIKIHQWDRMKHLDNYLKNSIWIAWEEGAKYSGYLELCDALWEAAKKVLEGDK